MTKPFVSVIVINWNGGEYLPRCLDALSKQTFTNFETIVVDNASTDGSADIVARHNSQIRLLLQQVNLGFAKANNLAAAVARGEWFALLNNDAFPEPNWLDELVNATQRYPGYAGFASCQIQVNNPKLLDGTGDIYHVLGLSWRRGYGLPLDKAEDYAVEIFAPCAAAALYHRERFIVAKGFDERFFCYCEDVDLAYRMNLYGDRFLYVPTARVHHIGSASSGKTSNFAHYHCQRNLVWVFVKNAPNWLFWLYLPGHLAINIVILLYFALKGEGRMIWKAKRDALRDIRKVWRQRREIQSKRVAAVTTLRLRMARGFYSLWYRSNLR